MSLTQSCAAMLIPVDMPPIPDEAWSKFRSHVEELDKSGALSGFGHIEADDKIVTLSALYTRYIGIRRELSPESYNGMRFHVLFPIDNSDDRLFVSASALFMLFHQDCMQGFMPLCEMDSSYTGSCFRDAQMALDKLKSAGVWEGGRPCLKTLDEVMPDVMQLIEPAREIIRHEWGRDPVPDIERVISLVNDFINENTPAYMGSGFEKSYYFANDFKYLVREQIGLEVGVHRSDHMDFRKVSIKENGEESISWLLPKAIDAKAWDLANSRALQKQRQFGQKESPLENSRYSLSRKDVEQYHNADSAVLVEPFSIHTLPRGLALARMREQMALIEEECLCPAP